MDQDIPVIEALAEVQAGAPVQNRACSVCSRKKARCPGGLPCARCARNDEVCEYLTAKRRGPKVKIAQEGQEAKRRRTESITLNEMQVVDALHTLHEEPSPVVTVPSMVNVPPRPDRSVSHTLADQLYAADSASLTEFSHLVEQPVLHNEASPSAFSLTGSAISAQHYEDQAYVASSPDAMLAPAHITPQVEQALLSTYWAFVHPIWPIFFRPAFDIANVRSHPALYNALLSLASGRNINIIVLSHSQGISAPFNTLIGVELAERAKMQLDQSTPSLQTVQCLFLLALREIAQGRATSGWLYSGTAFRMAVELELHLEVPTSKIPRSASDVQEASRAVWCCYVLDKYLAILLGRPATLLHRDIDIPLPSSMEMDEFSFWTADARSHIPPEVCLRFRDSKGLVISNFNALVNLMTILERIIAAVYSKRKASDIRRLNDLGELHTALMEWQTTYPATLGSLNDDASQLVNVLPHILYVRMWHDCCLVLLHRPFIPLESIFKRHKLTFSSSVVCKEAAGHLIAQCGAIEQATRLLRLTSVVVFIIFQAGIVHVANATSTDVQVSTAGEECLKQCIDWLTAMGDSYFFAGSYRHVLLSLQRLTRRDAGMADELAQIRASRQASRAVTPSLALLPAHRLSFSDPHLPGLDAQFGEGTEQMLFQGIQTSVDDSFYEHMPSTFANFEVWDSYLNSYDALMADLLGSGGAA